jgi:hypothetical protein
MTASTTATTMPKTAKRFQSAAEIQAEIRAAQTALLAKKPEINAELEPLLQALRRKRTELKARFAGWKSENGLRPLGKWVSRSEALRFAHHRNLLCQWLTHSRAQHPTPEGWVKQLCHPEYPPRFQLERYNHPSGRRTAELHLIQDRVNPAHFITHFVLWIAGPADDYEAVTADEGTQARESLYPMSSSAWQAVRAEGSWFETDGDLFFSDDGPQFPNPAPASEPARQ